MGWGGSVDDGPEVDVGASAWGAGIGADEKTVTGVDAKIVHDCRTWCWHWYRGRFGARNLSLKSDTHRAPRQSLA